ncbi:histidine--tRNA ligase [Gloeocapsa sp. PCC 73106]|uniref:histidine--tRNA ligase n=1 Tax=Gloeocapsa sp. PCC 73106 TaxID=102232 RepID=UPI0002ABD4B8|nr:histidine--tRNA ligase [Gloeocapsa sp. PCC 73106]ELR99064.1 histidyl-tRNA synthetase [Gloeocapsa sp. PCC 73106]
MNIIKAIRGTRDILPEEVSYWQEIETTARNILAQACYQEIRTPVFEQTSLFERGIGTETDVVGKEMYSFVDKGDRPITLRPEGTAGVVRAFIENNLYSSGGVQRLWYSGPMFRYERPQAGRQRQFHQIGLELLGSSDPRADVEAIALAADLLRTLGLSKLQLSLNSVGTGADRSNYRQALVDYLTPYQSELDPDSQTRLLHNPMRILDSKDERTIAIAQNAPKIIDFLSDSSRNHFDQVQQLLSDLGISYQLNHCLVRGLDYYSHTAFEIQSTDLGAQATVCGGGRYDGLVKELGGPDTPAIGWAMGMERLILLLQQQRSASLSQPDFYIVSRGTSAEAKALIIAQKLRHSGFTVDLDLSGSAFSKQFKRANRQGAIACLIMGDSEAATDTVQLKWMKTQIQQTLIIAELLAKTTELTQQLAENRQ